MPTAETKITIAHKARNLRQRAPGARDLRGLERPAGMFIASGIRSGHRSRQAALYASIMALCAIVATGPLAAEATGPDLSGRWTSSRKDYALDITRCGDDWCGVKLKPDGACGALALRLAARPDPASPNRLAGTLNLDPAAQVYRVGATAMPLEAGRPTELRLSGAPETSGLPTRVIPFYDVLVRGAEATCRHDGKVS